MYLSVIDSELRKVEEVLIQYNAWSTNQATVTLRVKIDNRSGFSQSFSGGVKFVLIQAVFVVFVCISVNNLPMSSLCCFVLFSFISHVFVSAWYLLIPYGINNSLLIWTSPLLSLAWILAPTAYHMYTLHSQPFTASVLWTKHRLFCNKIHVPETWKEWRIQALIISLEDVTEVKNQHLFG